MSFTIQTKQPLLQNLFSACGVLTDEATFEVTEQGLGFRGMDPSHIAMIDVAIPSTEFSKFEGTAKFGVRVDEALKVVKRFGKEDEVTISEADSHLILSNGSKTYKLRLIEASASNTPIPKLKLEVVVQMDREQLDKIFSDISAIGSEKLTIDNGIYFVGSSDAGEAKIAPDVVATGEGVATYSLDYLSKMVKGVNEDKVTMEYSSKMPICLTMGYVKFYLAPRVQD